MGGWGRDGAPQEAAVAAGAPTVYHDAAIYKLSFLCMGKAASEFWNHSDRGSHVP